MPKPTPVINPDDGSIVATAGLVLTHVPDPPAAAFDNIDDEPRQAGGVPVIVPGVLHKTVITTNPLPAFVDTLFTCAVPPL